MIILHDTADDTTTAFTREHAVEQFCTTISQNQPQTCQRDNRETTTMIVIVTPNSA